MARLSLVPQKREFFSLFNRAAANIVEISERLIDLLDEFPDRADDRMRDSSGIRSNEAAAAGSSPARCPP